MRGTWWPIFTVSTDACAGQQSALHPQSVAAHAVAELSTVLFVGGGLIFIAVAALLAYALLATPARRAWLARERFIVAVGIAFPIVALTALLVYAFGIARAQAGDDAPVLRIAVTGHQWWWHVAYLNADGTTAAVTANEIRLPANAHVELLLASDDVLHSFWVPNLAGKLDMVPGRVNRLRIRAEGPGIFRGQCAEYCGGPHARMALHVVALERDAFDAWLANESAPARAPSDAEARAGEALFMKESCAVCHTIRGTRAEGTRGPDLTHFGSRDTIGAAMLPNNAGTIAGWIAGNQDLKPGNLMPAFRHYSGRELRALAAYLQALE